MLEPIMVAARIQFLASGAHGDPTCSDRIIASSQGALMQAMDAAGGEFGSESERGTNLRGCVEKNE